MVEVRIRVCGFDRMAGNVTRSFIEVIIAAEGKVRKGKGRKGKGRKGREGKRV